MSTSKEALLRQMLAAKGVRPAAAVGRSGGPVARTSGEAPVLSFAQERLWFVQQLQPDNTAYLLGQAFAIRGSLDSAALAAAWTDLLVRHPVLRSGLPERDGRARVVTLDPAEAPLAVEDLSALAPAEQASAVAERTRSVLETPFDLSRAPLVRLRLLRLSATEHRLLFCVHHLLFDGWSIAVLLTDLGQAYAARRAGRGPGWSALPVDYADYAGWQRRRAVTPAWTEALRAWEERLSGLPTLHLPADLRRPEVQSGRGAGHRFVIPAPLVGRLRAVGDAEQATPYMTFLAGWQLLLARYSGQSDFGVGSPVANRGWPELEGLVGFFVNLIVLRADLAGDPDFRTLLRRTAVEVQGALSRQEIPFDQIVERLRLPRDPSRHPLFQAGFTFQNVPGAPVVLPGVVVEPIESLITAAKFDVLLMLEPAADGSMRGLIEYSTDLFESATIARLAANFIQLLESVVADPGKPGSQLAICSALEQSAPIPSAPRVSGRAEARTLAEWFRITAQAHPGHVAVTDGDETLTYAELDRRSEQLAAFLRGQGAGPDRLVAIALERSTRLIVAMLGVVKAGAGYLPVDPAYPADRQAYMVSDAGALLVLSESALDDRIAVVPGVRRVRLDRDAAEIAAAPSGSPAPSLHPEHTAYVIYTSGSTGRPKGVPVTHRNVVRLFTQTDPWFGFGPDDVWTMFHSFAFDFSVWEIWGALLYGGRLVVVPYAVSRATDQFHAWLARERVTVLNQTPSAFRQLIQHEEESPAPAALALRYVIFGGEALDLGMLAPWFARHGATPRMINMYGITETTVHVTYREITSADVVAGRGSVIGLPIPDLEIHLLDAHLQPVPRGVPGEICVGGAGLARGYLNRPELTAERFIAHPLAADSGGRLYRSGDSARRLANGDLEYLGRIDFQVKIRGFRIELGEIEAALGRHPAVAAACVLADRGPGGDARLLAWLVARGDASPPADALRQHLQGFLPDYMVPAAFTFVDRLPLTNNGKIDRAALRSMEGRRAEAGVERVAPSSAAETLLAGIWARVLGVPEVGVTDNFFALGGDSIRSLEVRAAVRAAGWDFPLQDLFRLQTVRELAPALVVAVGSGPASAAFTGLSDPDRARLPADAVDAYPLTALQAGMIFHSELHPDTAVFHDLFSYHLRVSWDEPDFRASLAELIRLHPILRTSFPKDGLSAPLQCVHADAPDRVEVTDLRGQSVVAQSAVIDAWWEEEKARGFDWTSPGLYRIRIHRRTEETIQFSLSLHHAIMDGWSVAAFLSGLFQRYLARRAGRAFASAPVPRTPVQREFGELERAAVASDATRQFWQDYLADPQVIRLPRRPDRRAEPEGVRQEAALFTWRSDHFDALKEFAAQTGVSLKHVLLAVHARVIGFLGNQSDVITGVISNGRPESAEAASGLGLFLNTAPHRLRTDGGSWRDLVRAALRADEAVHPHRRFPLAELQRGWGRKVPFETAFNFVHFHVFDALRDRPDLAVLDTRFFDQNTFAYFAQFSADGPARTLQLELRYDPAEFTAEQAAGFVRLYDHAITTLLTAPDTQVHATGLLGAREWAELAGFNPPPLDFDRTAGLHDGFVRQARRQPDAPALTDGTRTLSYAELEACTNAWAAELVRRGAGPERLVGVCLERGADLVCALLAVLKSGAAYVPLDPLYPPDRLAFMCADADVRLLVSRPELAARLPTGAWTLLDAAALRQLPPQSLVPDTLPRSDPANLAYLIYTSGSTGRPKATAIEHRSAVALQAWARATYRPDELAGVLFSTSVCFDLSIFELFVTLEAGGEVIVAENALALPELPARARVTLVNTVPSAMNELVRSGRLPSTVRVVNLAGEPLPARLADQIYAPGFVRKVYDLYGPSEDTTYSTCALRIPGGPETIGQVLPGSQLYLLDAHLQPVPLGTVGELYLGGEGLARGYLGRADLTADRFIPDPFSVVAGARLYRTGDLGRFRPDGQVEFLGRSDHQIKIRGFRIELGEIEAVLRQHPAVAEAAVVAREDEPGRRQLVGYVVGPKLPVAIRSLDQELRPWLGARLPEYFVPAAFVRLEALPLTPNGKLDRKALPAPTALSGDDRGAHAATDDGFVAPRTPAEATLASIWCEVLKLPRVGVNDNYFALGGDSILVLQVVSRAREAGLTLSPRLVFERPTIAELATAAATAASRPTPVAADNGASNTGPWALLPIQHWFFAQAFADPDHWNQSVLLATREALDPSRLQAALDCVVAQHPALQLRFTPTEQGSWAAERDPRQRASFAVVPWTTPAELTARCSAEQAALDLRRGALMRATLFVGPHASAGRLFIVIHHLVIDGVSWRVLLEDLQTAYRALQAGRTPALPAATAGMAAWATWQRSWAQGAGAMTEAAYWQALARDAALIRSLPRDQAEGRNRVADVGVVTVTLEADETEILLRRVLAAYGAQINDVLLAALATVLRDWTGRDRTLIHLEGHGRESAAAGLDLSRSVGWFTSLFPVALERAGTKDAVARVAAIRKTLAAVPERGVGYGAGRWLTSPPRWEVAPAELCFNYLGQVDALVGEGSAFAPASESVGPHYSPRSLRAHLVDANAIIVGGQLRCEWHFGREVHHESTVRRLAEAFRAELRALIAAAPGAAAGGRFDLVRPGDTDIAAAIDEVQF